MRSILRSWACAALLCAAGSASAQASSEDVPNLRLSGFGTIGAVYTDGPDGWGVEREFTQPENHGGLRMDVDSRIGLQGNLVFNPQFEAVAQVVLNDRTKTQNVTDYLQWGFLAWRPSARTTVRFGRTSPSIFMLSDTRNVGYAFPMVRPSLEYYSPLPLNWIDGADVNHDWDFGDVRWSGRLMYGYHTHSDKDLGAGLEPLRVELSSLWAVSLGRTEGGLRLTMQYGTAKTLMRPNASTRNLIGPLEQLMGFPVPSIAAEAADLRAGTNLGVKKLTRFHSLGAEYDTGTWVTTAEISYITGGLHFLNGTYGYVTVGRRLGDFTLFGTVNRGRADTQVRANPDWYTTLVPIVGPEMAAQIQGLGNAAAETVNTARVDQSSIGTGVRWDFRDRMALKLQWDHYRVRANGEGMWFHTTPAPANINLFSVALDFVF